MLGDLHPGANPSRKDPYQGKCALSHECRQGRLIFVHPAASIPDFSYRLSAESAVPVFAPAIFPFTISGVAGIATGSADLFSSFFRSRYRRISTGMAEKQM